MADNERAFPPEGDDEEITFQSPPRWMTNGYRMLRESCGECGSKETHERDKFDHPYRSEQEVIASLRQRIAELEGR